MPFFCQDVLERKIEELSRHLAEEKQVSKREKIHVARLHRELARYKGDKEVKEVCAIREITCEHFGKKTGMTIYWVLANFNKTFIGQ